jgi:hypothetical protein
MKILYLGTTTGAVYRGENGGATSTDWTRIDVDASGRQGFANTRINAIAIDPNDARVAWLAAVGAGAATTGRPDIELGLPRRTSRLFHTTDGGRTWHDVTGRSADHALPDIALSTVVCDDATQQVAYVGHEEGIAITLNGGESWIDSSAGLPTVPVWKLSVQRKDRVLFAATFGRGVYRRAF